MSSFVKTFEESLISGDITCNAHGHTKLTCDYIFNCLLAMWPKMWRSMMANVTACGVTYRQAWSFLHTLVHVDSSVSNEGKCHNAVAIDIQIKYIKPSHCICEAHGRPCVSNIFVSFPVSSCVFHLSFILCSKHIVSLCETRGGPWVSSFLSDFA